MKSVGMIVLVALTTVFAVFPLAVSGQDSKGLEVSEPYWFKQQECLTEWVSLDSMKGVWVENRAFCDTGRTSMWPNGVQIFFVDPEADTVGVMWSHLSPEMWEGIGALACPIDFTGDDQPEMLTLFYDMGNIWGAIHRLHQVDSGAVLESRKIPITGFDVDVSIQTFPPATSKIDTLVFPYYSYDGERIIIYYDFTKDSLQVVARK